MQCYVQNYFKCLVNRLKALLDVMISPIRSAFILGRLISDNALIAFECIHSLSTLKDLRGSFVLISWTLLKLMTVWIGISCNVCCGPWVLRRFGLTGL